ncbi:MAG: hypothetical protein COB51_10795, partial [Moraxellaceae bacterium]
MNPERIDALTEIISASCDDLQQSSQKPDADINLLSGIDHVENIAFAAQMVEMGCLEEICHEINHVLFDSPSENSHSPSERIGILTAWTQHVLAFLRHPEDPELAAKITTFLPDELRAHYTQRLLNQDAANPEVSNPDSTNATVNLDSQSKLNTPDLTLVSNATQSETDASSDLQNELMGVFLVELDEVHEQLDGLFNQIIQSDSQSQTPLWTSYLALVQRVKETATLVNLLGVAQVCLFVEDNINPLVTQDSPFADDLNDTNPNTANPEQNAEALAFAFNQWIPLTQQYLLQANDDVVFALINHLESSAWPQPLKEDHAQRLLTLLVNYRSTNSDSLDHEIIPTKASAKDVSLIVAADASVEIVDIFLSELPQQTQSLSKAVADINANRNRADNLQSAQRLAHTLKGASNLIGVRGIANVSHYLEDILITLGKSDDSLLLPVEDSLLPVEDSLPLLVEDSLPLQIKDLIQETCDCLEDMADSLIANPQGTVSDLAGQTPMSYVSVLQKILDFLNGKDTHESTPNANDTQNLAVKISSLEIGPETTQAAAPPSERELELEPSQNQNQEQEQPSVETLRIPVKIIESLFSLVEELTVQMGATHDKVKQLVKTKDELKQQDNRIQEKRFELENVVDVRGIVSRHRHPAMVTGYTLDGAWGYLEHDWVATKGTFIFEPAG